MHGSARTAKMWCLICQMSKISHYRRKDSKNITAFHPSKDCGEVEPTGERERTHLYFFIWWKQFPWRYDLRHLSLPGPEANFWRIPVSWLLNYMAQEVYHDIASSRGHIGGRSLSCSFTNDSSLTDSIAPCYDGYHLIWALPSGFWVYERCCKPRVELPYTYFMACLSSISLC